MASGPLRKIDKARLRKLVGGNNRAVAKAIAGDSASKQTVERRRRELLKYLAPESEKSSVSSMTAKTAQGYAKVLGVTPDDFLEPAIDPRVARLERLQKQVRDLQDELSAERE